MRLTLRTMLACLDADDRLDPADAEDLAQKIEQSKYATDLAQRIRRLVQHPRVSTPRLDGKGAGLDPNSVAEYLDNTLAHERIAEFEKGVLASDVQLAEVAACHQVLVLVLEQPAATEGYNRERFYRIGAEATKRAESQPRATSAAGAEIRRVDAGAPYSGATTTSNVGMESSSAPAPKPKPEVPDYLLAGRRPTLWPYGVAALLAFAVVLGGLMAFGPLDRTHPLARWLRGEPADIAALPADTQGESDTHAVGQDIPPEKSPPADSGETIGGEEAAAKVPDSGTPAKVPDDGDTGREPPEPATESTRPDNSGTVMPPSVAKTPDKSPPSPLPPEKNPPEPDEPQPENPPAAVMTDAGRLVSEDQILVRRSPQTGAWSRVAPRGSIFVAEELAVLPSYRPQVLLGTSVQLTFAGEARFQPGSVMKDTSHVHIDAGRALLVNVGKANVRVALNLAGLSGVVNFMAADSELAVEVRSYLPPGANPETPVAVRVVRLYTTRGKVTWQEGDMDRTGQSFDIESGHVRNYVGEAAGETVALVALPDWIDGKNLTEIDRRAAREALPRIAEAKELDLGLRELAADRRVELRSLGVRSLAELDQFEPILAALRDDEQRSFWTAQYDTLLAAISRGPEVAALVRTDLERVHGAQDGGRLFRMLWGYKAEELKPDEEKAGAGPAAELVAHLDNERLEYRIFAFENLRRITGATHTYQPQFNSQRRRSAVAYWRDRLSKGEVVYRTPPAPISDAKPAAAAPVKPATVEPMLTEPAP